MDAVNGSHPGARPAAREREFDEIADGLYTLRPDAFAAARDDEIKKARSAGRHPLARELSRLRRPTQSAWLVNLLWRNERDAMEKLFALADDLRRAQARASVPELHRLTAQRRELETNLLRRARPLAERAGVVVTASMEREVQETLGAALASADVVTEVRTGRLVKPAAYAGFGTMPTATPPEDAEPDEPEDRQSKRSTTSRPPSVDHRAERAQRHGAERREEAQRHVRDARAAVETAAGELTGQRRAAEAAHQHHEDVRKQIEELQRQLHDLREEVAAAERAARDAARGRDQAEKAHEAALQSLERAEKYLKGSAAVD
jgi:hypothetical protein